MSSPVIETVDPNVNELLRRDFIVALFHLLRDSSLYDAKHIALQRPIEEFERVLGEIKAVGGLPSIDLHFHHEEKVLSLQGTRLIPHFSIVEALKGVVDAFEISMIEDLKFRQSYNREETIQFFSQWAFHASIQTKPKSLHSQMSSIELINLNLNVESEDPSESIHKNRDLLTSSLYSLSHYYLLQKHTRDFFAEIKASKVIPQREIRRQLVELSEVLKISPYQLVALSLIREEKKDVTGFFRASQALATGLLSMALAKELEFPVRDQVNLGLIGLMYNVGMLGEGAAAALKDDRLTPVEYKRVLDAQAAGICKLIRFQGSSRPVLERLLAIFEHARGASEKSVTLTLEGRLLRMVSQYVALTSDRPFREAYTPPEAIKILGNKAKSSQGGDLDPILYYVFVRFLGIYPVGSLCLLTTGERAIVWRPHGEKRGIPVLKLLNVVKDGITRVKANGSQLLDLAQFPHIQIVKALDPRREGVAISGYFFEED